MPGLRWTYEAEQRLRTLYAMGASDDEIAQLLGISRGAVIGKRQRLDLFRRDRHGAGRGARAYEAALRRTQRQQPHQGEDHQPERRAE
jgi:hypothetical protein